MSWFEIIFMAVLQGATELFPISSLGHAVVVPGLLGWTVDQKDPAFLAFLVILHFGTAGALLVYFWRDWIGLLAAFEPQESPRRQRARRLILLLVVATAPAAVMGFVFNHAIKGFFASPVAASVFLIANAALLYFGDRPVAHPRANLHSLTWRQALLIGLMQCLALLPGVSRSGATIVGGLLAGLNDEESAHFSFLMATPIILGAGVLEIPKMMHAPSGMIDPVAAVVGGLISAVVAYLSIMALMAWFHDRNIHALRPFAGYCFGIGAASLGFYLFVAP